ncbi:MAG: SOS response-associated peptidase family protein [Saprospirales bacterium]|nr:SOS response-associated peptidase family protein [Saprospirales bacterium]
MCGRFSLAVSETKIQQELPFVDPGTNIRKSYNIAPTQHAYVVTDDQPGGGLTGRASRRPIT